MNKVKKTIFIVLLIAILEIAVNTTKVEAAIQANGKNTSLYEMTDWISKVRNMETLGGTFGLSETVNGTSLLATSESNNLDAHMQLNTEYGAMAILSASSYGNPNKIIAGATTTGNVSGIVMPLNNEWVSGADLSVINTSGATIFSNANARYKNKYVVGQEKGKVGDAMIETKGWHGATSSNKQYSWLYNMNASAFSRGYNTIFAYDGSIDNYYNLKLATRVVVIVGEGM